MNCTPLWVTHGLGFADFYFTPLLWNIWLTDTLSNIPNMCRLLSPGWRPVTPRGFVSRRSFQNNIMLNDSHGTVWRIEHLSVAFPEPYSLQISLCYPLPARQQYCCCLQIKPFFLPNGISSTPSVLPHPSSWRDTNSVVRQWDREKPNVAKELR